MVQPVLNPAICRLGYRRRQRADNVAGVDDRRGAASGSYRFLQLGAFGTQSAARTLQVELLTWLEEPVFVAPVESGGRLLYRVRIGPLEGEGKLGQVQAALAERGYPAGQPLP